MVEQLQRVDQSAPGFPAACELEANQAAKLPLEVFVGSRASGAALLGWVDHAHDFGPLGQEIGDGPGILDVAFDAERQRFQTLDDLEGIKR